MDVASIFRGWVRGIEDEFRVITQNNGHYAVQGHSRSPILVLRPNGKYVDLCDFLYV